MTGELTPGRAGAGFPLARLAGQGKHTSQRGCGVSGLAID